MLMLDNLTPQIDSAGDRCESAIMVIARFKQSLGILVGEDAPFIDVALHIDTLLPNIVADNAYEAVAVRFRS